MSHGRENASKRREQACADTRGHLYVGVLAADVGLGEVGEIVQIQEEGSGAVPACAAPLRPREGGRFVGQPVFWSRPPLLRSQFGRRASFHINTVLLRDRRKVDRVSGLWIHDRNTAWTQQLY